MHCASVLGVHVTPLGVVKFQHLTGVVDPLRRDVRVFVGRLSMDFPDECLTFLKQVFGGSKNEPVQKGEKKVAN